jgi:hypothetical protein
MRLRAAAIAIAPAMAILVVAGQARGDTSVRPAWAEKCEARLERARVEAARRDAAFGKAIVRFTEKDLSGRGFFQEEGPLVELVHSAYQQIPDLESLTYRVLITPWKEPRYQEGPWHRPENGSLGDPNDTDIYEVKYLHGFKGKLELWAPTPRQRLIFNRILRRAADECLAMT